MIDVTRRYSYIFFISLVISSPLFFTGCSSGSSSHRDGGSIQIYQRQSNPSSSQLRVQFSDKTSYTLQKLAWVNDPNTSRTADSTSQLKLNSESQQNPFSLTHQSPSSSPSNQVIGNNNEMNLKKLAEKARKSIIDANMNTYMIRVRLVPISKEFKNDVYKKSTDVFKIENREGLRIAILDQMDVSLDQIRTGQSLEVFREESRFVLDGQEISVRPGMSFLVEPLNPTQPSSVYLNVDEKLLSHLKINSSRTGEMKYFGNFLVKPYSDSRSSGKINWELINILNIESYLNAVVASEILDTFPNEAIRAQVVAARTYALRQVAVARCLGVRSTCSFMSWDVDPSTGYQSYLGASIEKTRINEAVSSTTGLFLSYNGHPILAMFHASSGGKLKGAKDIFCKNTQSMKNCGDKSLKEFPYLVESIDLYNGDLKRYGHGLGLPQRSAQNMAKNGFRASQILQQFYPGTQLLSLKEEDPKPETQNL